MSKEIRWKQRFQNFERAYIFFRNAVDQDSYNQLEASGLVQAFEFTFELGWKTLRDYLYEMGTPADFARDTIKESFQRKLIEDGQAWIDMLDKRNELAHTYNENTAQRAVNTIKDKYYPAIRQVYELLKLRMEQ